MYVVCVQVMTSGMTAMLQARWRRYMKCLNGFFTVLLVVCAFCGSCTFKNDPKQGMKFVKVVAEGEEGSACAIHVVIVYTAHAASDSACY